MAPAMSIEHHALRLSARAGLLMCVALVLGRLCRRHPTPAPTLSSLLTPRPGDAEATARVMAATAAAAAAHRMLQGSVGRTLSAALSVLPLRAALHPTTSRPHHPTTAYRLLAATCAANLCLSRAPLALSHPGVVLSTTLPAVIAAWLGGRGSARLLPSVAERLARHSGYSEAQLDAIREGVSEGRPLEEVAPQGLPKAGGGLWGFDLRRPRSVVGAVAGFSRDVLPGNLMAGIHLAALRALAGAGGVTGSARVGFAADAAGSCLALTLTAALGHIGFAGAASTFPRVSSASPIAAAACLLLPAGALLCLPTALQSDAATLSSAVALDLLLESRSLHTPSLVLSAGLCGAGLCPTPLPLQLLWGQECRGGAAGEEKGALGAVQRAVGPVDVSRGEAVMRSVAVVQGRGGVVAVQSSVRHVKVHSEGAVLRSASYRRRVQM